ncbi:MAG TPA: MFS transporter [Vicinamibacterales bacterium]|nr:MFS transporter [Vicinamibacterales bacterium]
MTTDALLVCIAGGVRAAAVSLVGVIIAIHLAAGGLSPVGIGLVIGIGIASSAVGTILVGLWGDKWGRRYTLLVLGLLTALGYVSIASTHRIGALLIVAVVGMVNGMGRDRGPASALDQAILPAVVSDNQRTWALAWYNVAVDSGHALGALAAVTPTMLERFAAISQSAAHALTFDLSAGVVMLATVPYAFLSNSAEAPSATSPTLRRTVADARTRRTVRKLALLFGLDSVGGGFLNSALIAFWFFHRYGMSEVQLAVLFFAARVLNVVSHLAAAWMARRIGLLNTMVVTHLPSSVLLMLAPAAPTAALAAALFLAREALVEMDVPTRQSYVMAVVPPAARTFASGMTNVTRNAGWAVGPLLGGSVMQHVALAGPLFIGGALKIVYDLMLYRSFRHIRPPEEGGSL